MKKFFFGLAICAVFSSCSTTYYYIVRHAEKQDNSPNSLLSQTGLQRAQVLRDTLLDKSIDTIFASTVTRTQQTAQPLATALGKTIRIYWPDTTAGLITALKRIHDKDVLVV